MRVVYVIFLLAVVAAVAIFAVQNNETIGVRFLSWEAAHPVSLLVGAAFLLGMFGGSALIGAMWRSYRGAVEGRR